MGINPALFDESRPPLDGRTTAAGLPNPAPGNPFSAPSPPGTPPRSDEAKPS
jgi:hypothetical protein